MSKYRQPNKKSFHLFYDNIEPVIENFTDEEIGKLFRAVSIYEMYGEITEFEDRALQISYNQIIGSLDRNMGKYQETCERNKRNRNSNNNKSSAEDISASNVDSQKERELEELKARGLL